MSETWRLDFLHEQADNPERPLAATERAALAVARAVLARADGIVVRLGGKAGRLGECIVATGLLEALFEALRSLGRVEVPIHLIVDAGATELFSTRAYRQQVWPGLHVSAAGSDQALDISAALVGRVAGRRVAWIDLHGAHDDMPAVRVEAGYMGTAGRHGATLAHLVRVGLRDYAARGPLRRYADFIEDLLGLRAGTLDGRAAQPRVRLSATARARYPALARAFALDATALQVVCFFQSVVVAKCYQRWDEVLELICAALAAQALGQRIEFLIACGPDGDLPDGVRQADLVAEFADFNGVGGNARAIVAPTPSLRDLAVLLSRAALALANDTGPGHLAGALGIPTVTPYLPGTVYSREVWASSLLHRGVTLAPNPYTFAQLRDAVLFDRTEIIDSIPPAALAADALAALRVR